MSYATLIWPTVLALAALTTWGCASAGRDWPSGAWQGEPLPEAAVTLGGETFGAQPDELGPIGGGAGYARIVTGGDWRVSDIRSLLAALEKARSGQTVFVEPTAEIDVTDRVFVEEGFSLVVPAGVTLASDRGHEGSPGAMLYSDAFQTRPLVKAGGAGVRVTGLRLRGPDPKRRLEFHSRVFFEGGGGDKAYYRFPNSDGVSTVFDDLEVDNCEISGWSHGGVYLTDGSGQRVHHSFLHHNQRMGLGYGICVNHDAEALIACNVLQDNKHHIAGSGMPGSGYEARNNIVLPESEVHLNSAGKPYGQDHVFDMHGGRDRLDGTEIAGAWLKIHHNTVVSAYLPVNIRGVPQRSAEIHHNWFVRATAGQETVVTSGRTTVGPNACGRPPRLEPP